MNSRSIAKIVAIAFGVAPTLWAPTAYAQTAAAPDLVISRVALTCAGMVVTVTNSGKSAVSASTTPIVVRGSVVVDVSSPQFMDAPLAVAGLENGQTKTVTIPFSNAAGANAISATVDATGKVSERDETNNARTVIDETSCPMLKVENVRVVEGGDLVFSVTLDRRPVKDASVRWGTAAGTMAAGGTACGGAIDFVSGSGTLLFSASGFTALTPKTIRIATCRDATAESAETMRLVFSGFQNVAMNNTTRTGTIDNQNP
jgi:CARDB